MSAILFRHQKVKENSFKIIVCDAGAILIEGEIN